VVITAFKACKCVSIANIYSSITNKASFRAFRGAIAPQPPLLIAYNAIIAPRCRCIIINSLTQAFRTLNRQLQAPMALPPAIPRVLEPGQTTLDFSGSSTIRKKPSKPAKLVFKVPTRVNC